MKRKIKNGHTNDSYYENNLFIQEKKYYGLNHLTNYSSLSIFDFVPKLIENNKNKVVWKWIDNAKELWEPTNDDLIQLAKILLKLHNSNVNFAKFNIKKRINDYLKIYNSKKIKIPIIDNSYKKINNILRNMNKLTPIHGDLWQANILKTIDTNKLFLVDWEYSHMGDRHFELAYFIESYNLSSVQEKVFLNAYGNYDNDILIKHKILVHYLTILWLHTYDSLPFSDENSIKKLELLLNEY